MISPTALAEIKRLCDLPRLVESCGRPLRKQAGRHIGWCPFCPKPRTPAFAVYQDHYYCHRCEKHGSAIDWMTETQGMRFVDAVEYLAGMCGVSLDSRPAPRAVQAATKEDLGLSAWWWARRREMAAAAVSNAVEDGDESLAETLGNVLRWIDAMTPADRLNYCACHSTAEDRKDYLSHVASEKEFTNWWMSLAEAG